jgi:hypothetical protein
MWQTVTIEGASALVVVAGAKTTMLTWGRVVMLRKCVAFGDET